MYENIGRFVTAMFVTDVTCAVTKEIVKSVKEKEEKREKELEELRAKRQATWKRKYYERFGVEA